MRLQDLVKKFETVAPTSEAEPWDNVGLLAGDPASTVARVLLTIDLTAAVLDEAVRLGVTAVYAYHPPIFEAMKRLPHEHVAVRAVRAGMAIYSPHTALDVAAGGTNDTLADAAGLSDRAPLRSPPRKDAEYKLVTFVPLQTDKDPRPLDTVREALFRAGAGKIGNYDSCSFRSVGEGTFFGNEAAHPTVGERRRLEHVEETRLEVVVPIANVEAVVAALRAAHPYEEPAFDLVRLASAPRGTGLGCIGKILPTSRRQLVATVKEHLGVEGVLVAGSLEGDVTRVAVGAGSAGDLYKDALRRGAEVFITGEMRHHDALAASARMTVVALLHSNSERATLARVAYRLRKECPGIEFLVSTLDRDPFTFA